MMILALVITSCCFQVPSSLRLSAELEEVAVQRTIPDRLSFNGKENLLEKHKTRSKRNLFDNNFYKTTSMYADMEVEFLEDQGCAKIIETVHSKALAQYFWNETFGPYKSDLCRLAQVAHKGGYYMDNDLEVVSDMRELIPPDAAFVSAVHKKGVKHSHSTEMFQAILGAAPSHPVIMHALDLHFEHYNRYGFSSHRSMGGLNRVARNSTSAEQGSRSDTSDRWIGPHLLYKAYQWWAGTAPVHGVTHHADHSGLFHTSYFFVETPHYADYGLQKKGGCCYCDWVVADEDKKKVAFYSRFLGAGIACEVS